MSPEDLYEYTLVPDEDKLTKVEVNLARESPVPPAFLQQQSSFKERKKVGFSPGDAALIKQLDLDSPYTPHIAHQAAKYTGIVHDLSPPPLQRQSISNDQDLPAITTPQGDLDEKVAREWADKKEQKKQIIATDAASKILFPGLQIPQKNPLDLSPPKVTAKPSSTKEMSVVVPFVRPSQPMGRDEPPLSARFPEVHKIEQPRRLSWPVKAHSDTTLDALNTSPVGQYRREPPTPGHELAPIKPLDIASPKSATSPSSKQQLPTIGPLLHLANHANQAPPENQVTRSRASSSVQTPNLSSAASTFNPYATSQASPQESAASPRPGYPTPLQIGVMRRPSMASDTYPQPLHSASSNSEFNPSPANTAFSPAETINGTSITTPSENGMRSSHMYQNLPPTPLTAHGPSTVTSPFNYQGEISNTISNDADAHKAHSISQSPGLATLAPSSALPQFQCTHPGCNAQPFQTQYLLNSHATVHSSDRPHYCLVQGCSRGPGGQGFKRKNEMKRHGLVHSSPGFICPYCPDREHRYPRPDNLQRHVRAHHADISPTDPKLREVLDKKIELMMPTKEQKRRRVQMVSKRNSMGRKFMSTTVTQDELASDDIMET
jgi:hypothetical protein